MHANARKDHLIPLKYTEQEFLVHFERADKTTV